MLFSKLASIKAVLNTSNIQRENNALYQVVVNLIDSLIELDLGYLPKTVPANGNIVFPFPPNYSSDPYTLDSYIEDKWVPTDNSGAALALTIQSAYVVKNGKITLVEADIVYPVTASGANASIKGLPFMSGKGQRGLVNAFSNIGAGITYLIPGNSMVINPYTLAGVQYTNVGLSAKNLVFSGVYISDQ